METQSAILPANTWATGQVIDGRDFGNERTVPIALICLSVFRAMQSTCM